MEKQLINPVVVVGALLRQRRKPVNFFFSLETFHCFCRRMCSHDARTCSGKVCDAGFLSLWEKCFNRSTILAQMRGNTCNAYKLQGGGYLPFTTSCPTICSFFCCSLWLNSPDCNHTDTHEGIIIFTLLPSPRYMFPNGPSPSRPALSTTQQTSGHFYWHLCKHIQYLTKNSVQQTRP